MADTILSVAEINTLFQKITALVIGYDYDNDPDTVGAAVRISWPTEGMPAFKVDDDVTFIRAIERDSEYNRQRNMNMSDLPEWNLNMETDYTRVIEINWVFYGPNSFATAQAVRDNIFYPETQYLLNSNNLYLIPNITAPIRAPELFMSRWWERTDLTMLFNELIVRNVTIHAIKSVEVIEEDSKGIQADVEIS